LIGAALSFNPFYANGRVRGYGERGKVEDNLDFVGFAANTNYSSSSVLPDDFESFLSLFPQLSDYKLPSHHPGDVLSSLSQLTGKIRSENDDAEHYLPMANNIMQALTPLSPFPSWMLRGKPTLDDFLDVVENLDKRKHPGFPACTLGSTKGQIIDDHLFDLYQACCYRVMSLAVVGPLCKTPYDFYSTFCSDVCCVSIKEEPIKQSKIGRIIIASSVLTEIIETLLYHPFDTTFKQGVYEGYSAIGVGFTKEDSDYIHASLEGEEIVCSDVPFFDGTVTLLEGLLNVEVVIHSYTAGKVRLKDPVVNMMRSMERSMFNKFYLIPDGGVYVQVVPGHQSTGRKETANFNTMTRARRCFAASLFINCELNEEHITKPMCAGDDCNESNHESLEYAYSKLDFPLRDVQVVEIPEFCSHLWPIGEKPLGQRIVKSFFKLISKKPFGREAFLAFVEEYNNHPDFPAYLTAASELRSEVNSIMLEIEFPNYAPYKRGKKKQAFIGPMPKPKPKRKQGKPRGGYGTLPKSRIPPAGFVQPLRLSNKQIAKPKKLANHKAACSILDPFCIHARNAQRPDGTVSASIPIQLRCLTSFGAYLTTGTNNNVYFPNPFYSNLGIASTAAGVWTMQANASASQYNTAALTVFKALRVVSFGLIARCTMTTATAKGTVIASTSQQVPFGGAITQGAMISGEYEVMTLAAGQTFTWISKPIGPTAHEMLPKATWNSATFQPQWTACNIDVSGGDATSGIEFMSIELVLNLEGIVDDSTSYGIFQKPAPAQNDIATKVANTAQAAVSSFTHGVVDVASKKLSDAAGSAMDSILEEGMAMFATLL
jgi:hypothetical protein